MEQRQTQVEERQAETQQNRAHLNLKSPEQIKAKRLESLAERCD